MHVWLSKTGVLWVCFFLICVYSSLGYSLNYFQWFFFFILAYADVDFIFSYTHFESIFAKNTVYKSREKLKSFFNLHFTLNLKKTNLLLLCLVLRRRMQLIWIAIIPVPSRLFMLGFRRCFLSVHSTDLCSCLITMIFSCLLSLSFSVTEQMRTIIAWS